MQLSNVQIKETEQTLQNECVEGGLTGTGTLQGHTVVDLTNKVQVGSSSSQAPRDGIRFINGYGICCIFGGLAIVGITVGGTIWSVCSNVESCSEEVGFGQLLFEIGMIASLASCISALTPCTLKRLRRSTEQPSG